MKPSELIPALKHMITEQEPVMIWGPPGAGKSDLMRQVAKDLELELRDVRLGQMDVVDVRGFPIPDLEKQVMRWLTADFLPPMKIGNKPNKTRGLLFFDELTSAPSAVQGTMYQLTLDRRIGEYVLPEGWSIICAGNRKSDRSVVHDMPAALANRLNHLSFEVDADDWQAWALRAGIDEAVRGFLRFKSSLLHSVDPNSHAWPSPRIWEKISKKVLNKGLPIATERGLITGYIGEGPSMEFNTYRQVYTKLPTVEQIFADPKKAPLPDDMACKYAIATMLDTKITPKNLDAALTYIERMDNEFQVLTMRGALMANTELHNCKEVTGWLMKNHAYVVG